MTALLIALLLPAQAKPLDLTPYQSVEVAYTMTTKGTVTCATSYEGAGKVLTVDAKRITFEGTWKVVKDSCQGNTVWVPGDGKAHHTLILGKGGKDVDAWVVHAKAGDFEPFQSNIKARGQYWINELEADLSKGDFEYTVQETQGMPPLSLDITHELSVSVSTEAAAEAPVEEATTEEAPAEEAPAEEAEKSE